MNHYPSAFSMSSCWVRGWSASIRLIGTWRAPARGLRHRPPAGGRSRDEFRQWRAGLGQPCRALGQPFGAAQGYEMAVRQRRAASVPAETRHPSMALDRAIPGRLPAVTRRPAHHRDRQARDRKPHLAPADPRAGRISTTIERSLASCIFTATSGNSRRRSRVAELMRKHGCDRRRDRPATRCCELNPPSPTGATTSLARPTRRRTKAATP